MKIYTKTGDRGQTGLFGGARVSKTHPRVEAYGDVDELVSLLGLTRSYASDQELLNVLGDLQVDLFLLSSELATPENKKIKGEVLEDQDVLRLEQEIDRCDEEIPPLRSFVLPGGSQISAWLQYARTVCRRAERATIALSEDHEVRDVLIRYLNRLSDLLFVLGRRANIRGNIEEVFISALRTERAKRKS